MAQAVWTTGGGAIEIRWEIWWEDQKRKYIIFFKGPSDSSLICAAKQPGKEFRAKITRLLPQGTERLKDLPS